MGKIHDSDRRRDSKGRYAEEHKCHACGKPAPMYDYCTDDELLGGSDGPGFIICRRKRCEAKIPEDLAERALHYCKGYLEIYADSPGLAKWRFRPIELFAKHCFPELFEDTNPCPGCGRDKGPYPDSPTTNLCGACLFGRPRTD